MGSFLSLQAYYGSTFVDGTGAVVGVGLLRNLGGMMTGMIFAGILAARMIPELRILSRHPGARTETEPAEPTARSRGRRASGRRRRCHGPGEADRIGRGRPLLESRRPRSPAFLLSQWGIAVGTVVGWQASQSMMGLPTETFFMMMVKMMWFRDVVGLVVKGLLFGALPATICCYEGLWPGLDDEPGGATAMQPDRTRRMGWPRRATVPVFRATCLSCVAILIMNSSWFMLVYHAVPFYGPTLLAPPGL